MRTICDVLTELYVEAKARGDTASMDRLVAARKMAGRMQDRLKHYALKYKAEPPTVLARDSAGRMEWLTKKQMRIRERRA